MQHQPGFSRICARQPPTAAPRHRSSLHPARILPPYACDPDRTPHRQPSLHHRPGFSRICARRLVCGRRPSPGVIPGVVGPRSTLNFRGSGTPGSPGYRPGNPDRTPHRQPSLHHRPGFSRRDSPEYSPGDWYVVAAVARGDSAGRGATLHAQLPRQWHPGAHFSGQTDAYQYPDEYRGETRGRPGAAARSDATQARRYSPDSRVISPKSTRYRRSAATSGWKSASRWLTSFSG